MHEEGTAANEIRLRFTRATHIITRMQGAAVYKIGAVSRRTGVSTATLRLWEDHYGLVHPERSERGTRLYSDRDVERVLYIRDCVRTDGYSLSGISKILDGVRQDEPPILQRLVERDGDVAQRDARALRRMVNDVRSLLEETQLRYETNRERLRHARLLTDLHGILKRLARSETLEEAATVLMKGTKEVTGITRVSLAIYRSDDDTLAAVGGPETSHAAMPVTTLAVAIQRAVRKKEPCYQRDPKFPEPHHVLAELLPGSRGGLYWQPLTAGRDLVGMVILASQRPDGISQEAQETCALLAVPAGPALAYFVCRAKWPGESPTSGRGARVTFGPPPP